MTNVTVAEFLLAEFARLRALFIESATSNIYLREE